MKYVAFLDILGFKNRLRKLNHNKAIELISNFSSVAFNQWKKSDTSGINGYIVSDSFIIYSDDTKNTSLSKLIDIVKAICESEFTYNGILVRGAIAKGDFDHLAAQNIQNLSKGLIVGQAYVDAYLLEDTFKSIGIILSSSVYQDVVPFNLDKDCYNEGYSNEEKYILSYFNFDFLTKNENLSKFVELGIEAQWLPHYYNTIYFAIKGKKNNKNIYQLFDDLIYNIGDPSECWNDIDKFIKNAFSNDVISSFQTRFLGYIRERIILFDNNRVFSNKRLSNREKIIQFLSNNPYSSISKISETLCITRSTVSKHINNLIKEGIVDDQITSTKVHGNISRTNNKYFIVQNVHNENL